MKLGERINPTRDREQTRKKLSQASEMLYMTKNLQLIHIYDYFYYRSRVKSGDSKRRKYKNNK